MGLQTLDAAGFGAMDFLAPEAIVDPAPHEALGFGPAGWVFQIGGHGLDTQNQGERPPTRDPEIERLQASNKLTRETAASVQSGWALRKRSGYIAGRAKWQIANRRGPLVVAPCSPKHYFRGDAAGKWGYKSR